MKLSAVLLLIAISTVLTVSTAWKTLLFPRESTTDYVELVPQKPLTLKAFTLCMRTATELKGEREVILFAYRTQHFDELNVWRELDGRYSFYLSGDGVYFEGIELGVLESHLCVTWDSSSGAANLFVDGKKSATKIYKKGHTIQAGGKILLGQDPDNYLGEFDAKQSFVGEVFEVSMWDHVLPDWLISDWSHDMKVPRGNVLDWETTEIKTHGGVEVLNHEL